jgi:hypothetical protein
MVAVLSLLEYATVAPVKDRPVSPTSIEKSSARVAVSSNVAVVVTTIGGFTTPLVRVVADAIIGAPTVILTELLDVVASGVNAVARA